MSPLSTQKQNEDDPLSTNQTYNSQINNHRHNQRAGQLDLKMLFILMLMCLVPIQDTSQKVKSDKLPSQQVKLTYSTPLFPSHTHLNLQQRCSVGSNYQDSFQHLFLEENMAPKSIYHLSGDEIGKECIKLGLSGRFTMKEALVELSLALARSGIDPKTHQFYPSQPLIGYFPYQVVILTDIVETTRALPTSMRGGAFPTSSMASPMLAPSSGVASSHSTQAPLCSSIPFPSPPFPPPTSPNIPAVTQTQVSVMDNQVLDKILTTVKRMCCILERPGNPVKQQNDQTDSDSEYFSGFSSSSRTPSLISGTTVSSTSSTSFGSQSSTYWSKSKLREESICIKFPHGSCTSDDWHTGNAHLCAKCYLSFDERLEPDHRTENNDIKMEEIEQAVSEAIEYTRLAKLATVKAKAATAEAIFEAQPMEKTQLQQASSETVEAAQAAKLAAERAKQVLGPIKVDLATPELGEITNQLPTIMINQNGKPVSHPPHITESKKVAQKKSAKKALKKPKPTQQEMVNNELQPRPATIDQNFVDIRSDLQMKVSDINNLNKKVNKDSISLVALEQRTSALEKEKNAKSKTTTASNSVQVTLSETIGSDNPVTLRHPLPMPRTVFNIPPLTFPANPPPALKMWGNLQGHISVLAKPVPLPQFSPPMTIPVFYRPPPKLVPHTISKTTSCNKQQMARTQYSLAPSPQVSIVEHLILQNDPQNDTTLTFAVTALYHRSSISTFIHTKYCV